MESMRRFLQSVAKQFVKNARSNLRDAGKGGGALESSINAKVVKKGNGYTIQFFMAPYGTFVDKGVKGKGGDIPTGKYRGSWGGRRYFINMNGKRQDSPYRFGSGSGEKDGLTRGIASWIRKKNLQPRDRKGKYLSPKGLNYLIRRNIFIRGIHGISFFQKALRESFTKVLGKDMMKAIELDILDGLLKVGWKKN